MSTETPKSAIPADDGAAGGWDGPAAADPDGIESHAVSVGSPAVAPTGALSGLDAAGEPDVPGERVAPGERGPTGARGERGAPGEPDAPGERGPTGARGERGAPGGPAAAGATGMPARRRLWRRVLVAGGAVTVLLIGGGVAAVVVGREGDGQEGTTAAASSLPTAEVTRRNLEERAELDGTLGYGEVTDVNLMAQGTITGLAPIGTVVDRGQPLVEVNGRPVPLLFGARPLWRELGPNVDDGVDVEQLEANLVALGIATESELTVDQDWTDATTEAVKEWQESLGRDGSGVVAPGDVAFLPGAVRIAEHPIPVGGSVNGPVIGVSGATRVVTLDLEASRQSLVETGQAVDIELPDGTEITGTVYSVGNVATSDDSSDSPDDPNADDGDGDSEATIEVVIALDDPAVSGNLDEAPVTVRVVTSAAENVLAVPVESLLALAEGGYAVEVMQDDGTTRLVAVELGAFADGWVEVTGDVAEGDAVVVPE